jgi:TetR/AcrR family transcriptional repressor of mexJK operon
VIEEKKILSTRGLLILEAAQTLFLKHGFDETSLEMIINDAGGSRRSIYHEFGNKKGLLLAVINSHVDIQAQMLMSINRELPAEAALNDVCFRFAQGILSGTLMSLFRLVVQQVVKLPELGEIIFEKGPMTAVLPLVSYLKELVEKDKLVIEDPFFAAQMLLEMIKGPLQTRSLLLPNKLATDEEIKNQVTQAVSIFLRAHTK